jgi:hypothetical protein
MDEAAKQVCLVILRLREARKMGEIVVLEKGGISLFWRLKGRSSGLPMKIEPKEVV